MTVDQKSSAYAEARDAVKQLLHALGYDVSDETISGTPDRVVKALMEMTSGRYLKAADVLGTTFPAEHYDEIILLKDISFHSTCEHHLLPFRGVAHVAYLPNPEQGRVVGLSKLARLVDMHARRLQIQERMTASIAEDIEIVLQAVAVGVIVEAEHMCMCARGVKKSGATMVTSVMRGIFRNQPSARAELLSLISTKGRT
jgi:GTP cyclohydrolase I